MKLGSTDLNNMLCWNPWTIAMTVGDIGTTEQTLLMISKIWRMISFVNLSLERLRMYSQNVENLKNKFIQSSKHRYKGDIYLLEVNTQV